MQIKVGINGFVIKIIGLYAKASATTSTNALRKKKW